MNLTAEQWRGHLAMLLFSALVAGSFSLGAIMADQIAPVALMAARFLIAGAVIGILFSMVIPSIFLLGVIGAIAST